VNLWGTLAAIRDSAQTELNAFKDAWGCCGPSVWVWCCCGPCSSVNKYTKRCEEFKQACDELAQLQRIGAESMDKVRAVIKTIREKPGLSFAEAVKATTQA